MKDIFFGCSKQIVRYAYLRRDVEHMKKLYAQVDKSKIIIFNSKTETFRRLEVLLASNKNTRSQLALLDLSKYDLLKKLLQKWLLYNIQMEEIVKNKTTTDWTTLDSQLKQVSLFWLGMDDMNAITNKQEHDNNNDVMGTPIYAMDISNSDELTSYINNNLIHDKESSFRFSSTRGDFLNLENNEATTYGYSKTFLDFIEKNNFCPSCGGHVVAVELGSRLYCLNDSPYPEKFGNCKVNLTSNNLQFPRTDPCIIIALYDETGRILLGSNRRRHPVTSSEEVNPKTGKVIKRNKILYTCFAGFMEPGETIEHCCMREVYEETGLRIQSNDIKIIESQPWPFPASLMVGCIGIVRSAEAVDSKINIDLDKELDHVQWFDPVSVDNVLNKRERGILSCTDDIIEEWQCPPKESVAGRLIQYAAKNEHDSDSKL